MYRVTHQVVTNLPLTSKQKLFCFGLARPGQVRPKWNFCYEVNGRFVTTWCVTLYIIYLQFCNRVILADHLRDWTMEFGSSMEPFPLAINCALSINRRLVSGTSTVIGKKFFSCKVENELFCRCYWMGRWYSRIWMLPSLAPAILLNNQNHIQLIV